ncbi:MAG: tyrosine-type recombinase/integrase [Acetobacter aceti]|uniref:Tyr recombinase domain-containing protein n=1 Tax=Acetobacter aceti TaxID=435 RepID=A0A1U9KHA4_ACEAC|nr:tyrosine-type recombinase/integrase [Acetobacter aceti]AQS85136.1 hypothetical protein A0U92_10480 [Acetobacter aceti]
MRSKEAAKQPERATALTGNVEQPWQLYKQRNTVNWLVRFSIKGQGQIRKSLGTPDEFEAKRKAERIYYEALIRSEQGLDARAKKVSIVVEEWLKEVSLSPPEMTVLNRYILGYFANIPPGDITSKMVGQFMKWRKDYWISGPGKDIDFIWYERSGRKLKRPIDKTVPSSSTLHSVEALLLKFLKFCEREQYIRHLPKFEKVKVKASPRASFTPEEVRLLESKAAEATEAENLTRSQRFQACLLYHYIGILASTGMRPTECLRLQWKQITKFDPRYEGPMRKSKTILLIWGKGKERHGFGLDSLDIHLRGLWLLYNWFWEREPTKDDFLWATEKGLQFKRLDILFNRLLEQLDLKKDFRGKPRDAYSFRHYFVTEQINNRCPVMNIARSLGTSVTMIERFYSHNSIESYRESMQLPGSSL